MARNASADRSLQDDKDRVAPKVALVQSAMSALGQALRKAALYLHQQSGLDDFFQPMLEGLKAFHDKHGALTLVIKPFDFFFDGESVFRAQNQENSITYKLYRAGIRSLTFEPGIVAQDLVALGRILLKTPMELQEEDLASLLWREGIPHIAYLQITSSEDDAEEGEEGSEGDHVEELLAYLNKKFAGGDPRNKVNFRSFAASDLELESFLGRTKTQRQLFDKPRPPAPGEIRYIRDVLAKEEKSMVTKGGELLFFLCKHAHSPGELREVEETFVQIFDRLFQVHDFGHLVRLLDAIQRLSTVARVQGANTFLELKQTLFKMFLEPERVQTLMDYLRAITVLREIERNDICAFLCLLGAPMYELLLQLLPTCSGLTRRTFLLALLVSSDNAHDTGTRLLELFEKDREFLLDLLQVGMLIPKTFTRKQLEGYLQETDVQVQRLALSMFLDQFPDEMFDMDGGLFKHANSGVLRSLFEVLCQNDQGGIDKLFAFVQTKGFRRMTEEDQVALYGVLGRSQKPELLEWFDQLLARKSRWFLPGVDRQKHLALRGLEAFGSFTAQAVLKKYVSLPLHSPRIKDEIAHALTFYHLYLRATKPPPQAPQARNSQEKHKR